MTAEKFDVYTHITAQIFAQAEAGTPRRRKPWTGGGVSVSLPERFNGEAYRDINILIFSATAMAKDHRSARWMTFNQAKQLGGHVRKCERSATMLKHGTVERADENGEERQIPYAKAHRVFNSDQIEGLPAEFHILPDPPCDLGTVADPELEAMKEDSRAIFRAPSAAQKAVDYIMARTAQANRMAAEKQPAQLK